MIRTLRGEGLITVESPEASSSGSFSADLKKPDSLRLEFRGPFGMHVGTLSLSHSQFVFYNSRENTAVIGKPDGNTIRSTLRVNLSMDEIMRAFTGEFAIEGALDSLLKFSVQDGMYIVVCRAGGSTKEFRIDGYYFIVNSYRDIDSQGHATLTALASRISERDHVGMPTVLQIIFPRERRSISIAYDDFSINEPVACSFVLPKQVERIYR